MAITKITRCCDACGKEITEGRFYFKEGSFKLHSHRWGGGSVGGDEDEFNFEANDLCEDCVLKIEKFVKGLGVKRKLNPYARAFTYL